MSLYGEIDFPHPPSDHPDWQESFVLIFRDRESNAVGFLRTGAYVNHALAQTHFGMSLDDGSRFRRHRLDLPYRPQDRAQRTAQTHDYISYSVEADHVRFVAKEDEAEADLRFYDFFPSQDWDQIGGAVPEALRGGHGHPESSGRVEGSIRLGNRVVEIRNGIGHRDHSFGPRPYTNFRSARWHAGTVGPALSWSLVTSVGQDGKLHRFGWMIRDGARERIVDFHTVNMTLSDGFSSIGGWTAVKLDSGEIVRIDVETVDGIVTSTHFPNGGPHSSPAGIEALSIARWQGHEGVCDFNMIDNPHLGDQPVVGALFANWQDGISHRDFDVAWIKAKPDDH